MASSKMVGDVSGSVTSSVTDVDDRQCISWPDKLVFTDFLNTRYFVRHIRATFTTAKLVFWILTDPSSKNAYKVRTRAQTKFNHRKAGRLVCPLEV